MGVEGFRADHLPVVAVIEFQRIAQPLAAAPLRDRRVLVPLVLQIRHAPIGERWRLSHVDCGHEHVRPQGDVCSSVAGHQPADIHVALEKRVDAVSCSGARAPTCEPLAGEGVGTDDEEIPPARRDDECVGLHSVNGQPRLS